MQDIPSPGAEGCDLPEDGDGVAGAGGGNVGLLHHVVPECLCWVGALLTSLFSR